MPRNVEIKARLRDRERVERIASELAERGPDRLDQEDVFFRVPVGRLKLRILGPGRGELIDYRRHDAAGPTASDYRVVETTDPAGLREVLSGALGVRGVIRKTRHLYLVDGTRIHVDRVEGLGDFLELEVVLHDGRRVADGERIAARLAATLGIADADLVDVAYIDLLERANG